MKTKQTLSPGALRPISRCVWAALALLGAAQAEAKFAEVPLYLQNKTETSGNISVKHNIMFFIDDSGSMSYNVAGTKTTNVPSSEQRLTIAQTALNRVLSEYQDQFNWGLQTLHNNGNTDTSDFSSTWSQMQTKINGIKAKNGTPTTRRYYEIVSNIVMPKLEYRCQKSYVVLMSDGDANLSSKCGNYLNSATKAFTYPAGYAYDSYFGSQPQAGACYSITGGSYNTFWDRDTGLSFFSDKLATTDFKTGGVDKAGVSWDGDKSVDPAGSDYSKQLVQTFTVAFGGGVTETGKTYLSKGASSDDYYFDSQSADSLVDAFKTIADTINSSSQNAAVANTGTVAPAATSSGISGLAASVRLDSGTWSSRLEFYGINTTTGAVDSSSPTYAYFKDRKTLINTDGKNVSWADNYKTGTYGSNTYFGLNSSKTDEWKEILVPWVIRAGDDDSNVDTHGTAQGYSQNYRTRTASPASSETRNLGDIVDSPILTIGGGSSDGLLNGRNEFLVTAANDGMVHLFRSNTDTNPYSLALSYIPAAMERETGETMGKVLKDVANEGYGNTVSHRYLINGGIVVRRTASDAQAKGQQSFMFGAMGQGGRGAYALNIGGKHRGTGNGVGLDGSDWTASVPLFETAKSGTDYENKLGYTVGTPQIGRIALKRTSGSVDFTENTRYAGFLASGYGQERSSASETALYVYEMLGQNAYTGNVEGADVGSVIKKFTIEGTTAGAAPGLSSPTLVDTDFDGVVDVAYAGDYAGNMYRFDMRADSPDKWTVTKIFSGSESRPITSAPAVSRRSANNYVVIFGTGSDIYQNDVSDKTQQAVYGIYDDLNATNATVLTESDLQTQTLSDGSDGYRKITSTNAIGNKKGWVVPLGATDGERVVVKPTMVLRTAVISTRIYDQKTTESKNDTKDVCRTNSTTTETSQSSWILSLNAETGGALSKSDARLEFIQSGDSTTAYYAGKKYDGITSFTYMDATKLNDTPVSRDGDSGGSGTDQAFKAANTDIPTNKCFSRDAVRTLLLGSSEKSNNLDNLKVTGRICGIRRLSWREIFF